MTPEEKTHDDDLYHLKEIMRHASKLSDSQASDTFHNVAEQFVIQRPEFKDIGLTLKASGNVVRLATKPDHINVMNDIYEHIEQQELPEDVIQALHEGWGNGFWLLNPLKGLKS